MSQTKTIREPLMHISKRTDFSLKKAVIIRASAIIIGLLIGALISSVLLGKDFGKFFSYLFLGNFTTSDRVWLLIRDTTILLGVGLALVPAFKMKFWNLGGNGQILIGCVTTIAFMHYLGGKLPDGLVIFLMTVCAIIAGAIWGLIPALFKALFNTNESLFTLMMNYIAIGICEIAIKSWSTMQTGNLPPIYNANIPDLFGNDYLLTILLMAILTVVIFVYMKYSKHGYEVSVVGESQSTAKYVGINVKKVIIRTMLLSGAICGLVGLLLGGAINHTISANLSTVSSSANFNNVDLGFTAIMVAWLGNFNPFIMIATAFLVVFMTRGMDSVKSGFGLTESAIANIVVGILYFCIIGCEFFIRYKIHFRNEKKNKKELANEVGETNSKEEK